VHVHVVAAQQRWRQLVNVLLVDGRRLVSQTKRQQQQQKANAYCQTMVEEQ
jgi:hypothetical protein